ncbi:MAG: hypothetical protein QOG64_2842, partial [Acidimicrobiaceae bacterium]|nr:hypothetical protein [Acidimicrobiaceae bacterium]
MDSNLRDLFDRYGPTLALIATIVLLVALLPSNAKSKAKTVSAGDTNAGASAGNASLQSEAAANPAAAGTPGATAAA